MSKRRWQARRLSIAGKLRHYARLLASTDCCTDANPLHMAADQCLSEKPNGENTWGYDIVDLVLRFDSLPKGSSPAKLKNFYIQLSVMVRGDFKNDSSDCFTYLCINLEKYAETEEGVLLKTAWHFDRHIGEKEEVSVEAHPLYHFQHGGNKLKGLSDLGETFHCQPPRLMHPPMDGILAIDFVLSNYSGEIWNSLRDDGEYMGIVEPAYEKLWKPYFEDIAAGWSGVGSESARFMCPQI